jgi:AAA domain-containing protein
MRTLPGSGSPLAPSGPVAPSAARAAASPTQCPHPSLATGWTASAIMDDPITAGVLHSAWSGDSLVAPAPPGSGKTRLVGLLAASLAERAKLRVGIAAQTRDQAVELARRLGGLGHPGVLAWSVSQPTPELPSPARCGKGAAVRFPPSGGGVIVATTARWLVSDPARLSCDVMIVDEAWQATYADLGALGAFAGQVVCVGDPGQIDPVVTGQVGRWQGSATAPNLPAPDALLAAHGDAISVVQLRHTWRLGPETTALIQPVFYPDLPFTSRRPDEYLVDAAGQRMPEVAAHRVQACGGPGDPVLVTACADLARSLLGRPLVTSEGSRLVEADDLAVVTAHVGQSAAVRALLADLPGVLVGTANQLQGLEREAVVALHPLAGYREPSNFGTDLGRACVMLSRHRAHLALVVDAATREVLSGPEPDAATVAHFRLLDALGG